MSVIAPAFADPVLASQAVFRTVMQAVARPAAIMRIASEVAAPVPLSPAAAAIALTLLDYETPVWLDAALAQTSDIADWISFHTGAPRTDDPQQAAFAFVAAPELAPGFDHFALGSDEYPDRSTTMVLQVKQLIAGEGISFAGPGIAKTQALRASPLPSDFQPRLIANRNLFPRGVDLILATDHEIAALPRSLWVVDGGC
jgi:alpha-D-ribose 1-methylphosphonate 5-triphosphate synthase subunit PhnH